MVAGWARWLACAALLAACGVHDAGYQCHQDSQCGSGGRCEPTGFCSEVAPACAPNRRYVAAGSLTGMCTGAGDGGVADAADADLSCDCSPLPHIRGHCMQGACIVDGCQDGFAHCSANPAEGCEVNTTQVSTCGGCNNDCAKKTFNVSLRTCSLASGATVRACDYTTCLPGASDADGIRSNGCESRVPLDVAERDELRMWLQADQFFNHSWPDITSNHSDGFCADFCPSNGGELNRHRTLVFDNSVASGVGNYMWIRGDFPNFLTGLTIAIVWKPAAPSGATFQDLLYLAGGPRASQDRVELAEGAGASALEYTTCTHAGACSSGTAANAFTPAWHRTVLTHHGDGTVQVWQDGAAVTFTASTGSIVPLPSLQPRSASQIGWDGFAVHKSFAGEIAEILIYDVPLSPVSETALEQYLTARYGF